MLACNIKAITHPKLGRLICEISMCEVLEKGGFRLLSVNIDREGSFEKSSEKIREFVGSPIPPILCWGTYEPLILRWHQSKFKAMGMVPDGFKHVLLEWTASFRDFRFLYGKWSGDPVRNLEQTEILTQLPDLANPDKFPTSLRKAMKIGLLAKIMNLSRDYQNLVPSGLESLFPVISNYWPNPIIERLIQ